MGNSLAAPTTECLLGLQCRDFVMLAADQNVSNGIVILKHDEDKMHQLAERVMMAVIGEPGDTANFVKYIASNIQLYKIRNKYELSPAAVANFTQRTLTEYLRTQNAYNVNILMGGHDHETGPQLYFMDNLGSAVRVPFAGHGFGGLISMSIMECYHREDASKREAYEILKLCVKEIQKRLTENLPNFQVTVVDKDGVRALPVINSASLVE